MDTEKARMGLRNNQRSKQLYRASYPPNHCNPDRPRRIPDGKTEIRVVGALVLTLLHVVYDLCQTCQHVVRQRLCFTSVRKTSRRQETKKAHALVIVAA